MAYTGKDIKQNNEKEYCRIFNQEIDPGLCWEISNIGNDSLQLPQNLMPPCGWDEAHKICDKCPVYLEMLE